MVKLALRSSRRCRLVVGLNSCGGWEDGRSCDIIPMDATNTIAYRTGAKRGDMLVDRVFTAYECKGDRTLKAV